jgi:hypothetical protein
MFKILWHTYSIFVIYILELTIDSHVENDIKGKRDIDVV